MFLILVIQNNTDMLGKITAICTILIASLMIVGCKETVYIQDKERGVKISYNCMMFSHKAETSDEINAVMKEFSEIVNKMINNERLASLQQFTRAESIRDRERAVVEHKCN